jgi:hypothetical protein
MAALAIVAGLASGPGARADDTPVENKVNLDLQISGLGGSGCQIEIKPGHAACQFRKVEKKVERTTEGEALRLDTIAIVAKSTGADRDCSFAITVREPGQPARTYRRGVRLVPHSPDQPTPIQSLRCYLNAPAVAAKEGKNPPKR